MKARAFKFTITVFGPESEAWLQDGVDCRYLVYGFELAPTTGHPHLEGYVYFKNPRSVESVRKEFIQHGCQGYVDYAKGSPVQNYNYSTKDGQFFERGTRPLSDAEKGVAEQERWEEIRKINRYGNQDDIPYRDYMRHYKSLNDDRAKHRKRPKLDCVIETPEDMRPWQRELWEILQGPVDSRKIYWYVDEGGGKGKTQMWNFLLNNGSEPLAASKTEDSAYALPENPKIVCMNLVRAREQFIPYALLESIKDGAVFSGKYQSGWKFFNSPHLVVFANFKPDESKMSSDRWVITEL